MRRRMRVLPRPALTRRAVVAFPENGRLDGIEAFRRRHDPLAAALRAHVTLVFPFASTLSGLQVATHVRRTCARWPVLPIRLEGVDAYTGEWVHVLVTRGRESIIELHDRLYRRALSPFLRREFDYMPHVTIGRAADWPACEAMVCEARATFRRPIDAVLRTLSILALPTDGELFVETEIGLGV
ncbi:MAG TPA: 2'-5' RNA ligase family protein [Casimicrobiaceae bacterium]|nr:2'-5' RNA ligase family protein [Casimicrobiaceae bacterium]